MSKEQRAYVLAMKWHGEQMYGDKPYEVHLQAVRDVLVEFGCKDEDILCAAWLHDVLEDTDCPARTIAGEFGSEVLELVWAVTGYGKNRKERWSHVYGKIIRYGPSAAILKAADRIANMRASKGGPLEQMYLKAWPDFRSMAIPFVPDNIYAELLRLHTEQISP